MLLVSLADHYLVHFCRLQWQAPASAITPYQIRILLKAALPLPVFDIALALQRVNFISKKKLCRLSISSQVNIGPIYSFYA